MDRHEEGGARASSSRNSQAARRTRMRVMHRKSQGLVAVYEQDPTAEAPGTPALVFETPTRCTRVSSFPQEWQRLSDDELVAIQKTE